MLPLRERALLPWEETRGDGLPRVLLHRSRRCAAAAVAGTWRLEGGSPDRSDVTPERLLTARELAGILGLKPATILDKFERGELPGFRLGGRVGAPVRFRWSEVEAWLEQGRKGPQLGTRRLEVAP